MVLFCFRGGWVERKDVGGWMETKDSRMVEGKVPGVDSWAVRRVCQ